MGRKERQERRERRRKRREEREKLKAETPPLISLPENSDPLLMYAPDGRPIGHALRDWWRGKSAFLVGAGPSINTVDYQRLGERGVCSLGINNVAGYVPVSAMTFSDPPEKFHHGIFFDPSIIKFVPKPKLGKRVRAKMPDGSFRLTRFRVSDCPSVIGFLRSCTFEPDKFLTDESATWGNNKAGVEKTGRPKCIFTFFLGFRLLHYLGVRRIYLLGVDFGMHYPGESFGNYAFEETGVAEGNNDHYRVAARFMADLQPVFAAAGLEVYQTNKFSRLTVFPHVPFEEALEDCRRPVPAEPFDLGGWYRFKGVGYPPDKQEEAISSGHA